MTSIWLWQCWPPTTSTLMMTQFTSASHHHHQQCHEPASIQLLHIGAVNHMPTIAVDCNHLTSMYSTPSHLLYTPTTGASHLDHIDIGPPLCSYCTQISTATLQLSLSIATTNVNRHHTPIHLTWCSQPDGHIHLTHGMSPVHTCLMTTSTV